MAEEFRLRVEGVSKRFPGVWALRDVSFDVLAGEVHGLVGENGAGKSTLMGIASGALAPDEGAVSVNGVDVSADPDLVRARGLAIVRQEPALMPDLSVAENIYLGVSAERRPRPAQMNAWAQNLLRQWDPEIAIDAGQRVDLMNAQQRFIIEIVKALAGEPTVLVLDEPTEHMMSEDVARLFDRIRALTRKGVGVVYISHRIREVRSIADRVTVLREGQSQGSHAMESLTEKDIVALIVGKAVDHEFPKKEVQRTIQQPRLQVTGLSGEGFSDVSLSIQPGEILGLAGMDGQGKREFVAGLVGLTTSRGNVTLDGVTIGTGNTAQTAAQGIQYLSGSRHRDGMFGDLSVRENFSYRSLLSVARGGIVSREAESAAAGAAVRSYDIKTPGVETRIGSLSGGNQQKVLIAGILASDPKVVIIDEPTQGVDIGARVFIYQAIAEAARSGISFIIVSSDAGELAGICHRVAVFSSGHVVSELGGDEVSESAIISAVLTSGSARKQQDGAARLGDQLVKWFAGNWAPLVTVTGIILALGFYAGISNEFYLTPRSIGGMLTLVAALAMVACGQQVLMLIGGIDLSVGPLMGLTSVVMSFFFVKDMPVETQLVGWLLLLAVAVMVGVLNWALVDPLGMHPMMATLATFMLLQSVSLVLRPTPMGMIDFDFLDTVNTRWAFLPVAALLALVLALVMDALLFRSGLGIKLRGFGSRADAARVAGINPRMMRLLAYVGCSTLSVAAGVLMIGQVGIGDAMSGNDYTLASIAAAVVGGASLFGGRGSFVGAFLGALLITQVNVVTTFLNLTDGWRSVLLGVMIVVAVAAYSRARKMVVAA
ncbi:ATP-binding cassette domain-containing protein [Pseudotabrizicola sp. 4114]|uniref:ATP-binding cassette domain-containing protein n=1 Tax=Pseudotabrizicola sp. 4114 TaxID=2817731 RepID=UPI0028560FE5|nr:ribose transport system ATP-binding protein [Pseudorhodobacter sp. 4114]